MSNKLYKNLDNFSKKYATSVDLALEWMTNKVKVSLLPGANRDCIVSTLDLTTKEAFIYNKMIVVDEVVDPYTQITKEDAEERALFIEGGWAYIEIDSSRITKMINALGKEQVAKEVKNMEFFFAVETLAKEKDISVDFIFEQFKESIVKAAKRLDAEARKQAEAKRRAELRKAQLEREALGIEEPEEEEKEEAEEEKPQEVENIFCDINTEMRTIRIFRRMSIVEEVTNPKCEITEAQALHYGGGLVGGNIEIEIEPKNLGRLFALSVKNIIRQAITSPFSGTTTLIGFESVVSFSLLRFT